MDEVKVEILRLAYIRVAQAATLLTQAQEDLLAKEAGDPGWKGRPRGRGCRTHA